MADNLTDLRNNKNLALEKALGTIRSRFNAERESIGALRAAQEAQFNRSEFDQERGRDRAWQQVDSNALQRGILRSGIRERNRSEVSERVLMALTTLREQWQAQERSFLAQLETADARQAEEIARRRAEVNAEYQEMARALADLRNLVETPKTSTPLPTTNPQVAPPSTPPASTVPTTQSPPPSSTPTVRQAVQTVAPRTEDYIISGSPVKTSFAEPDLSAALAERNTASQPTTSTSQPSTVKGGFKVL